MSASALLRELPSAGIRLARDVEDLVANIDPGASLDTFRERIQQGKPALLRESLQREIQANVTVDPSRFDRERYDELWRQWRALPDPEAELAALTDQLEAGWDWLTSHPDHPEREPFLDRWIARLRQYERACSHEGSAR